MKSKLKIPKGWRKLRKGTIICKGDKFECVDTWMRSLSLGCKVGGNSDFVYIRKIKKSQAQLKEIEIKRLLKKELGMPATYGKFSFKIKK